MSNTRSKIIIVFLIGILIIIFAPKITVPFAYQTLESGIYMERFHSASALYSSIVRVIGFLVSAASVSYYFIVGRHDIKWQREAAKRELAQHSK